ncbi:MAG TPA: hypothetical protein VHU84_10060 [Lacipirellulaceae bacterium]|nr:hypothetical protein [Lacipirellulaceae bacterium]
MLSRITALYMSLFNFVTGLASRVIGGCLSNRCVALATLGACAMLAVAPWLRPAISRDFRGIHIPWSGALTSKFLPEFAAEVPRPWRWDGVAMPILVVVAVGVVIVLIKPVWTRYVFGLLLALSIPAVAAAFWNHPAVVEFLEGEVRQRAMIRAVIRQHADDMLSGGAPDRLSVLGGHNTTVFELETVHPLWYPLRYSLYGPWLIALTLFGVLVVRYDSSGQRLRFAGAGTLVGIGFAVAITWPRWVSEYHWAQSETQENANQISDAANSLERALAAMPQFEFTRRYWLARGRIEYRQHLDNEYVAFFKASQHALQDKPDLARAELEPQVRRTGGTTPERDLLSEIIGRLAVRYVASGDQSASEVAWRDAAELTPWQPAYWIAETSTVLAAEPRRAREMEDKLVPRLNQVGDRMVNSDFTSLIADAYFVTGDLDRARDFYARAMVTFDLPKYVNLHAQKGMLGM